MPIVCYPNHLPDPLQDQLGQESDFVCHELAGGRCQVDAFAVLFDVSAVEGRPAGAQSAQVALLTQAALRTKRPVFLLASKCDRPDLATVQEFQRLAQRKDFQKNANFGWVGLWFGRPHTALLQAEVSAFENVNVADFLYLLAQTVDRARNRLRLASYAESERLRARRLEVVR